MLGFFCFPWIFLMISAICVQDVIGREISVQALFHSFTKHVFIIHLLCASTVLASDSVLVNNTELFFLYIPINVILVRKTNNKQAITVVMYVIKQKFRALLEHLS